MAFSFGASAPAPSGSSTFSFGASSAPVPALGGFGFGAPSPAPMAFGATPSMFGSSTTPAGESSLFGSTPAPASASGGFGFGSSAPAPGVVYFGSPAPLAFGVTSSAFGSALTAGSFGPTPPPPLVATAVYGAPAAPGISYQSTYSALHPQAQQAIDAIHEQMLRHRRSMLQVETMGPALLRDVNPGQVSPEPSPPLKAQLVALEKDLAEINTTLQKCGTEAMILRGKFEQSTTQSLMYGIWPIEALAARRGVLLSSIETAKKDPNVQEQLRKQLDMQTAYVDRIEKIPSPFMWQQLADMENRFTELTHIIQFLKQQLEMLQTINNIGIVSVVQQQTEFLRRMHHAVVDVHSSMEVLRNRYHRWERGSNVLERANVEDEAHRRRNEEQVKIAYIKAAQTQQQNATPAPGTLVPVPSGHFNTMPSSAGLFGSTIAPTPTGGGFIGSTPAPAPVGGGLFGSAPTPAPVGGGLFGSTPASAPVGGGLFGSTPALAPVGGGLFGNTQAPGSSALFGSTPPVQAPGGLFNTTTSGGPPAFGTAATPTFGAHLAPASDASGGFGSFASSSSFTPKSKKSTTTSRRRK